MSFTTIDTLQQRVNETGICHFFRGNMACAISRSNMGFYWGHIGLLESQPHHGSLFVKVGQVRLYKVTMSLTGNRGLDNRWWLGFEGSSPESYSKTLMELKTIVDGLMGPRISDV